MAPETKFVVDRRPLWVVLLVRSRHLAMVLAGGLLYWLILAIDTPPGLSENGQRALAAFALCVFYWVFSVLPLMITSLLAMVVIPLSGVLPASATYALFGNEAVFFILGAFILAACLIKSKLSTRMALAILQRFGHTPKTLLLSILLMNAAMAFVMSEHAVAAMNFPIVAEIAAVLRLNPRRSSYGKALFIAMAWGSTIGGIGTLLGGARAPLALGMLREATGQSFSFLEWSVSILPLVLALLVVGYLLILWFFPIDIASVAAADEVLRARRLQLGRMRPKEKAIAVVTVLTIAAWVMGGEQAGLANIALIAVVAVFALQLVTWQDIEGYVNWGVLLMYGGAICLGTTMSKSGAADWMAQGTISQWASSGPTMVLVVSLLCILLTEAMSNSAVVALMMPVGLGLAQQFGIDPRVIALTIAVPAGLAYALPIGTPANAIAYSSGYFTMRDIVLPGMTLAAISWILFNAMANLYWPLLGLSVVGAR